MRKVMMLCFMMLVLATSGCLEMLTPEQMQQYAVQAETLVQKVETYQAATADVIKKLADLNLIDANAVAKINHLSAEVDRVQGQVIDTAVAIKNVQLSGDNVQDWINTAIAANRATAPYNPYSQPIDMVLGLAAAVAAWLAAKKIKEAKKKAEEAAASELKYQAHKQGVEKTVREITAGTVLETKAVDAALYSNIGEARANLGVT